MMNCNSARRRDPGSITLNACTKCRKKRVKVSWTHSAQYVNTTHRWLVLTSKCDGKAPCERCASQNAARCVYEMSIKRTKENMKAEIERLQRAQEQSMRVFEALKSSHLSVDILEQLRNGAGVEIIARNLERFESPSTFAGSLYDGSKDTTSTPSAHRSISSTPFDVKDLHSSASWPKHPVSKGILQENK